MKITELYYKSESTGSIDPSSSAYRTIWTYTPTEEESKDLLNTVKINSKITLGQYFEALKNKNTKLLDETKLKPNPETKVDQDEIRAVGGTNETWRIEVVADGQPFYLTSGNREYYLEFPKITFSKGTRRAESKDGPSFDDLDIKPQRKDHDEFK